MSIGAYILIAIVAWPVVTAIMIHHFIHVFGRVDTDDIAGCVAIGLIAAPLWPITLAVGLMTWLIVRLMARVEQIQREDAQSRGI